MTIRLYQFLDVSAGVQAGQFGIGGRSEIDSLDDLDPTYKRLLDEQVTAVVSVIGADGRPSLTPMWFEREVSEDDPTEGARVSEQLDGVWTKYTGAEPPYGLRDPSIDERRVLFECRVDKVSTFGQP